MNKEINVNNKIKAGLGIFVLLLPIFQIGCSSGEETLEVSIMELGRKDLKSQVVADGVLKPETEVKLSSNNTT